MKKIKVLMISSSGKLGGGPTLMYSLGNGLSSDFEVYFAIPKNTLFNSSSNIKGNLINISERKITFKDIIGLIKFVNKKSIDIIHAHGKGAAFISRILKLIVRKPLIYSFHGVHLKCHNRLKQIFYIFLENLFGLVDTYKILSSKSEKIYANQSFLRLGKNHLIINNGVKNKSIKSYIDLKKSKQKNLSNYKIRIISICRFVQQKNVFEILEIAKLLPNFDFYVIGSGPLFGNVELKKKENNLKNLHLLGEKKKILKYLYKSDIYLSTSLYEGLPISTLEAMSVGMPIISTNVTGNKDTIVHAESGFLYELGKVDIAAKFINNFSEDKTLLYQMGKNSYNRQREKFTIEKMCRLTSDLYKEIYLKK